MKKWTTIGSERPTAPFWREKLDSSGACAVVQRSDKKGWDLWNRGSFIFLSWHGMSSLTGFLLVRSLEVLETVTNQHPSRFFDEVNMVLNFHDALVSDPGCLWLSMSDVCAIQLLLENASSSGIVVNLPLEWNSSRIQRNCLCSVGEVYVKFVEFFFQNRTTSTAVAIGLHRFFVKTCAQMTRTALCGVDNQFCDDCR